jgi:hypothetical protein
MAELTMSQAAAKTKLLTGQEIAPVSLRAAAARGALKARKKGSDWYTTDAELRKYLASRPQHFKERARSDKVTGGERRVYMATRSGPKSGGGKSVRVKGE